jgi:hypothetical protein
LTGHFTTEGGHITGGGKSRGLIQCIGVGGGGGGGGGGLIMIGEI